MDPAETALLGTVKSMASSVSDLVKNTLSLKNDVNSIKTDIAVMKSRSEHYATKEDLNKALQTHVKECQHTIHLTPNHITSIIKIVGIIVAAVGAGFAGTKLPF